MWLIDEPENKFINILYDKYSEYNIRIYIKDFLKFEQVEVMIIIVVNNVVDKIVKKFDRYNFVNNMEYCIVEISEEIDNRINVSLEHEIKTAKTNASNKNLKPLICPCCGGVLTKMNRCDYCDMVFE